MINLFVVTAAINVALGVMNFIRKDHSRFAWISSAFGWLCALLYALGRLK